MSITEMQQRATFSENKIAELRSKIFNSHEFQDIYNNELERQKLYQDLVELRDGVVAHFANVLFASVELAADLIEHLWNISIQIRDLFVTLFTKLENGFYRGGEDKSPLRSLAFVLVEMAGEFVVPVENQVLDYRKTGQPEEKQRGELLEAIHVYQDYLKQRHANKLWVLEELGDALYNLSQAVGVTKVIDLLAADNPRHREFGLVLFQIAEAKFEQRYMYQQGVKNERQERLYISEKGKDWKPSIEEIFDANAHAIPFFLMKVADVGHQLLEDSLQDKISAEELVSVKKQLVTAETVQSMLSSLAA